MADKDEPSQQRHPHTPSWWEQQPERASIFFGRKIREKINKMNNNFVQCFTECDYNLFSGKIKN